MSNPTKQSVSKINEAIDLIHESFSDEQQASMEGHSLVLDLQGDEELSARLTTLQQYLVNKFPKVDKHISTVGDKVSLDKLADPLLDLLQADSSEVPEDQRFLEDQYEAIVALGCLPLEDDPQLRSKVVKTLNEFSKHCENDDIAKSALRLLWRLETSA